MAVEIRDGFRLLAKHTEIVAHDPQKAERIREQQRQVERFLAAENLVQLENPQEDVRRVHAEEAEQKRQNYMNHLAAVAKEALQVADGEFVHPTKASVAHALREGIKAGDPNLFPHFTNQTLANQILLAGRELLLTVLHDEDRILGSKTLGELLDMPDFRDRAAGFGWLETLQYMQEVLPKDTTGKRVGFLLLNFSEVSEHKSVEERLQAVRA